MEPVSEEKLVFDAEWHQSEAAVTHHFVMNFYTKDNSLELIDTKSKKVFLRRTPVDTVCGRDLFPGARIFAFGRKIHVTGYGNLDTKQLLSDKSQKAFLLVPGQNRNRLDNVFRKISKLNIKLDDCFMKQVSSDDLIQCNLLNDERIVTMKYNILNEPSILFELSGKSIDKKIEDIQEDCPDVYGCQSDAVLEFFFRNQSKHKLAKNENNKDSILCLIKPHTVHANQTGDVLAQIYRQGFVVSNIRLRHLDRSQCDEFLRIYEGVLPEFIQMSIHLASGPLIALELTSGVTDDGQDVYTKFRNLCGPYDSEIAKKIRPHTLRAEFGVNNICNAVHCTDLKDDVQGELDFFFS